LLALPTAIIKDSHFFGGRLLKSVGKMWWARYNNNFMVQSVPASKEEGSKLECIQKWSAEKSKQLAY